MSIKSGLRKIKIPFILNNQPDGVWAGYNVSYGIIPPGRYLITWNPRLTPVSGTILTFQFAISSVAPFGSVGSITLAQSPKFGSVGQDTTNNVSYPISSVVTISHIVDIYIYIASTTTDGGGWKMDSLGDLSNLDNFVFTKLA
jgi:hypothetical protein